MDTLIKKLKEKNIRVTPQRAAVYQLLMNQNNHLTAETIYEKIKLTFPSISLATVYSILELLKEKKLVNEIRIDFDKSYFDAKSGTHHHFRCTKCGIIRDIDIPACHSLHERRVNGCSIEDFHGYFYGTCARCSKGAR